MNVLKVFKCGSSCFFSSYDDYKVKDEDEIHVCDSLIGSSTTLNMKDGNKDIFFVKKMSACECINDCLECKIPMRAGRYLIPDIAEYFGIKVEDIERLRPCFDNIDKKHTYEKIIFESYLENGGFYLTDSQRLTAYMEYKKNRPGLYGQ